MSTKLTILIKSLTCQVTNTSFGSEHVQLNINGKDYWGPFKMDNGYTHHFIGTSLGYIPVGIEEGEEIKISIMGEKFWKIFPNNTETIKAKPGEYVALYRGNWSCYTLYFCIERHDDPAILEIVKPNLGQPQICIPQDLLNLQVKLSTRSVTGDIDKAFFELQQGAIVLEDIKTGKKWPCKLSSIDLMGLRKEIQKNRETYKTLREELNNKPDSFPRSNSAFRAGCGILTDFDIKLKPDVKNIDEIKGKDGWPKMFNLQLGESMACHSIYVSEKMTTKDEFKFLHITDTHVTVFNDTIASQIKNYTDEELFQRATMLRDYQNPNDHLRATIKYANINKLDFVVITGDLINCNSDGWFEWKSPENSNIRKFRDIITGKDGLGEALQCPLFLAPGNHEFYPYGIPLQYYIDPYALDELGIKKPIEKTDELDATGLSDYNVTLNRMGNFYKTNAFEKEKLHPSPLYALIVNTYPQFFQYLMELSYDVSYFVKLGAHYIVLLNTGQDIGRLSKKDMFEKGILGTHLDYLQGGSQCVGFSTEDEQDLEYVLKQQNNKSGLVLLFTHAPLINLEKHPDIENPFKDKKLNEEKNLEVLYEYAHQNTKGVPPPNKITKFLCELEPGDVIPLMDWAILLSRGFPQGGTRHFYTFPNDWSIGKRDELIDFGCANGGSFKKVMQLISGIYENIRYYNNLISFAGHTHHIHEFRSTESKDKSREGPSIYVENYAGNEEWTKLPVGHKAYQLPNQSDKSAWRRTYAPLFLISGALKGKEYPQFREVFIKGTGLVACIESMKMKQIQRLDQEPLNGMEYFYAHECIGFAEFYNYLKINKPEDLSSLDSYAHIRKAIKPFENTSNENRQIFDYNDLNYIVSIIAGRHKGVSYYICKAEQDLNKKVADRTEYKDTFNLARAIVLGNEKFEDFDYLFQPIKQLEILLFKYAGLIYLNDDLVYPSWYNNYKSWIYRKAPGGELNNSLRAVLYAGTAVRLNRFGVNFGYSARNSLQFEGHYEWAYNELTKNNTFQNIQNEVDNRISKLTEFAKQKVNNLLCMWFTNESIFLAELGGYENSARNSLNTSVHFNWALSVTPEVVVNDLIEKFLLQINYQYLTAGINGLKRFYSISSTRLATWGTKYLDTNKGEPINPEYYLEICSNWNVERITNDLTMRVRQFGEKMIKVK